MISWRRSPYWGKLSQLLLPMPELNGQSLLAATRHAIGRMALAEEAATMLAAECGALREELLLERQRQEMAVAVAERVLAAQPAKELRLRVVASTERLGMLSLRPAETDRTSLRRDLVAAGFEQGDEVVLVSRKRFEALVRAAAARAAKPTRAGEPGGPEPF